MSPRFSRLIPATLAAAWVASCGGEDRIELLVDPPDAASVARVGLRVWDTEMHLVADHWLEVGDGDGQIAFPWRVPLVPAGDARWFLAEVELYDDDLCPRARAVVTGASGEPAPELVFSDTGMTGCAAAFVDPAGAPGECTERGPCADLDETLDAITEDGRPEVVFLRGGVEHRVTADDGAQLQTNHGSGEPDAPFMLRAWPGTGTPRVRTASPQDGVVRLCCNVDAARYVVVDGLDLAGGVRFGVEINGEAARGNVIRHCVIHDNGLDLPGGPDRMPQELGRQDAAVIVVNDATDTVIELNVLADTGVRGPGSPADLPGVGARTTNGVTLRGNLIRENAEEGVVVGGGTGAVAVDGNVVCRNGAGGIEAARAAQVTQNSVVDNAGVGIELDDDASRTVNNLVVGNDGVGLSEPDQSTGDWLHDNGDGREDGDPRFLDPGACVLTLRAGSPARGARDGATPGAR